VEQLVSVRTEFDAHHQLNQTDRVRCARSHGHHWTVVVEKTGKEDWLEEHLVGLVDEMADRSLNEMFPMLDPSPEQLSVLIMERLLLRHPTITSVSVSDGRLTGITRNVQR